MNHDQAVGYAAALRDAIEVIHSLPSSWEHPEYPNVSDIDRNVTIAAIENLRG